MPEPAAEPPVSAESAQLSLKVRTLDQRTYPITICAAASVPQLKELVATETGVTLARQRLIYRGRVLKNDQTLAAYSLEDGHVLHLVVRAVPPVDAADQTPASATPAPDPNAGQGAPPAGGRAPASFQYVGSDTFLDDLVRMSRSRLRQPPPPRDNDEPDPTMGRPGGGGLPSRVVMGATISMPEGADVTMPFLNSMMANLVTQVEGGEGLTAARGRRRATFSREVLGGGTAAEMEAATARALRHHHRNRDGSGRQRHGRRSSSSSADRQRALRVRTGVRLESVRATLDDASLDFPAELSALPQGDTNAAMAELQQQVEMLLALVQRFGPRLRLLSAALAQRDRMVTGPEERRAALGNELLRVMEPFIPDLVDYLVRATSASRAAAFGTSSATFLRTMAQQIVRQLRVYARGDSTESEDDSDERLKRLLRGLLVWLGVNEHIASFVVDSLLCWTEGDNASSRRGRTRQREETGSEDGATGSPATKRRRE
ncbi:hypothetical protein JG687_00001898 [Phytophthora cactorum]|uniref:Ubiquitin-like domain-containing protein n=1 Tax=Phytophthora cactorum TaxID=29920 RepID=A0A8T1UWS2_9STRA|nr:hypothetical protein JG687_00001898 [Phytophthora cactorum]